MTDFQLALAVYS